MGVVSWFLKSFKIKRATTFFPILGVAVGVMSVIIISSVGAVGKRIVKNEIDSLGLGGLMISSSIADNVLSQGELNTVRSSDVITAATPIVYGVSEIQSIKGNENCILWGVDDNTKEIMKLKLLYGREISKADICSEQKVCIVDAAYAKSVYKRQNIVGKKIKLAFSHGTEEFTVVGITDSDSSLVKSIASDYIPYFVYVPYVFLRTDSGDDFFSSIAVSVNEGVDEDIASKALLARLSEFSGFEGGYKIENMVSYSRTIEKILLIITTILSLIAGISLLISGISIMTVMLFSVGERTAEIGIKKAIGAGFFDILFEFLCQAVAISLVGGVVGSVLGILASFLGCKLFSITPVFDVKMIAVCMAVTTAFGIAFGIYPAVRAAKLDPAEALRRN